MLVLWCVLSASTVIAGVVGWSPGTATFYGGSDGSGTMGGACGYGNLYSAGYGVNNAALSQTLFNDGASCGQCYAITCDGSGSRTGSQYCKPSNTVTVTATNLCPPNYGLPNGGWCGPGRPHFDMSQPAWENIGIVQGGIIPCCTSSIQNLGGSGSVAAASVKGTNTGWIQMSRNWGANWQALSGLTGQALSFAVTSTGGQYIQFLNVAPTWWQFGQTYSTNQQFYY
nr:expansin 52 [Saccharum hybrid cultivar]